MLAAVIRGSVGVREGKQCSQHFSPRYVTRGQSFAHTAKTWGPGPELALTLRQTRTFEMQGSACWPIELLSLFWLCFALASAIMQTCCINVFANIFPLTFSIYTKKQTHTQKQAFTRQTSFYQTNKQRDKQQTSQQTKTRRTQKQASTHKKKNKT